jgi:predicted SprT family Zn-dependent metalloprotease
VTVGEAMETLCHEWAHALAWTSNVSSKDHDAAWGKAYARVYRVVFEQ